VEKIAKNGNISENTDSNACVTFDFAQLSCHWAKRGKTQQPQGVENVYSGIVLNDDRMERIIPNNGNSGRRPVTGEDEKGMGQSIQTGPWEHYSLP